MAAELMSVEQLLLIKAISRSKYLLYGLYESLDDAGRLRVSEGRFASSRSPKRIDLAPSAVV